MGSGRKFYWAAFGALTLGAASVAACSSDHRADGNGDPSDRPTSQPASLSVRDPRPLPPDDPYEGKVQRHAIVEAAKAFASQPLRDLPSAGIDEKELEEREERDRGPLENPFAFLGEGPDTAVQRSAPMLSMPVTIKNFLGQGTTLGGCIFPRPDGGEPSTCTTTGVPPDTNGAVGPNHYVQVVNGGIGIWHKDGTIAMAPKLLKTLWAGYTGTNAGNKCATQNDGDPVVLYDQLADRWFVTQFSLPNIATNSAPSYQCVAVSQTGDPTGAYNLYDYQYNTAINDYGKFGVWHDAYYASYNNNGSRANVCAFERAAMIAGTTARQVCFTQGVGVASFFPASVDGPIKAPNGSPGLFLRLASGTSLGLGKFHVDWTNTANSNFTTATISVNSYSQACGGGQGLCVPQPSPGNAIEALGDRPMFHISYRNFGDHESLLMTHSVTAGSSAGPRWYEIRTPFGTPTAFQQSTFAPDTKWRWMGAIAQDMAQDMALGYSVSSSTQDPSIGWTGRINSDPVNTMAQGEAIIQAGNGVETGTFSDGSLAQRWGDYSNMSIDPSDDCTFWYTTELYPSNGVGDWDTRIASTKFPNCGANDFSIALQPTTGNVQQGKTLQFTVQTTSTKGTPESISLFVQDLPAGVTGAFQAPSVNAGGSTTLTLTASATAAVTATPVPFIVIGTAKSAAHKADGTVGVIAPVSASCGNGTVESGEQCDDGAKNGTVGDCCSASCTFQANTVVCRPAANACDVAESCTGNSAACPADGKAPNGTTCNDGSACTQTDTCQAGVCTGGNPVTCTAKDECHDVGTCDPASGTCSNPAKADGTACSVGTCQAGTCTPSSTPDSGAPDSGGGGLDSGGGGFDSGGGGFDSGGGGTPDSSAPPANGGWGGDDSGAAPGDDAGSASNGDTSGNSGGCGCRTAGASVAPTWLGLGFGALAIAALRARRSRKSR